MAKQQRYSPEVKERAVRLLREQRANYETEWAAISSVASKIGCTAETLRLGVRRGDSGAGRRPARTPGGQRRGRDGAG